MMRIPLGTGWLVASLFALGCGNGGQGDGTADASALPDGGPGSVDAAPADAGPGGGFVPLVTAHWTLAPGQEGYVCASKTLTEDIYVGSIRPISPPGTHHTTTTLADGASDTPGTPCGPMFGNFYASGVGTGELVLPPGVGLVAHKGQSLHLNLHIFNASDVAISGTSGIEAKLLDPTAVQHVASVQYPGVTGFAIPSNGTPYSDTNTDPFPSARTVVAIFPHMHRLGTHFRARVLHGGTPTTTLWDQNYQFESQEFAPLPSVSVAAGDELETTCTWVNTTGATVSWGDSTTAEMCFAIIMTY